MIARWLQRNRGWGSRRQRLVMVDVIVDENGDAIVDSNGVAFDSSYGSNARGIRDERGLLIIDENEDAIIAL